jgi:dephospho-CoA kinase
MRKYISVGITGGIGSGKSFICQIIDTMGYPVFYADNQAKKILSSNLQAVEAISELFGEKAYLNGELNRSFLAESIFNNPEQREKMNTIVHPLVRKAYEHWADSRDSSLVFNEAAILFETGSYKNFDKIILVTAPEKLRINRIQKRDEASTQEIKVRMNAQWSDEKKIPLADIIIINDEVSQLLPQIVKAIEQLTSA